MLTAGSDPLFDDAKNTVPGTFEQRVEVYSPPYLYPRGTADDHAGARRRDPRVDRAAGHPPTAPASGRPVWSRPRPATHVTSVDQRSVALDVNPSPNGVTVRVPPQATFVPPGSYMLFLVDDQGVPSVAKMVTVP